MSYFDYYYYYEYDYEYQVPQQFLIPSNNSNSGGQLVFTDQYNPGQPMHVIRIQAQPSPASGNTSHNPPQPPQHIIIQQQGGPQGTNLSVPRTPVSHSEDRAVPNRFKNLTDEQIARRRKANAERSRRRRAMETPEQRAERNRRTAERMRQRRAKIAETRGN